MSGDARGGNDRLIAGSDAVEMWGDAEIMKDRVVGGNDTFVFADTFGRTRIYDFEKGKDHLEIDISGGSYAGQVSWETVGSDVWSRSHGPEAKGEIVLVGFIKSLGTGDFYFV
jgi:Ca2+-binding RTX toxin-like protein